MTGKVLVIVLLLCGAAAGAAMYYLQVYGFYYEVADRPGQDVALVPLGGGSPQPIAYDGFQAIDADSSPIRYRACFTTDLSLDALSAAYEPADAPEPLTAPAWFDCYDATTIAMALEAGQARAYLAAKNIHYGVDRIVTVTEDGRGYVWHALNNCGRKAYDGTVVGEECPARPENCEDGGQVTETLDISAFMTVTLGLAVYLIGVRINDRLPFLERFSIPEPVTGGLLASLVVLGLYSGFGIELAFDLTGRDFLLVLFFTGIGLNARLGDLIAGGKPLAILLVLTLLTIVAQNVIGVLGAVVFGFPPQSGVLFGSAALIGGHGTAIAWAPEVAQATGLASATELGVAVATLGLVIAALIGGPIATWLIDSRKLTPSRPDEELTVGLPNEADEAPPRIDHKSLMRVLLTLNVAILLGFALHETIDKMGLKLPLFVPCLLSAIVVGNLRSTLFPHLPRVSRTPTLALISEFALGAFLAMSLMSLQLWTIAETGLALAVIIAAQTLFAVGFILLVLFRAMGGGYRAAVLAAGFGGFALGATPTAIANMTAVTKRYGPSPLAFIVLPLVSAFFVDIANAVVIQMIVNF